MNSQIQILKPFAPSVVKQLDMGAYRADYVSWTDKIQRLIHLGLSYDWTLDRPYNSGDEKEPVGITGRLTVEIDGTVRKVDGVGQGRDAKNASTDAFSRACAFLGLGLHLWCQGGDKDGGYWVEGILASDE